MILGGITRTCAELLAMAFNEQMVEEIGVWCLHSPEQIAFALRQAEAGRYGLWCDSFRG